MWGFSRKQKWRFHPFGPWFLQHRWLLLNRFSSPGINFFALTGLQNAPRLLSKLVFWSATFFVCFITLQTNLGAQGFNHKGFSEIQKRIGWYNPCWVQEDLRRSVKQQTILDLLETSIDCKACEVYKSKEDCSWRWEKVVYMPYQNAGRAFWFTYFFWCLLLWKDCSARSFTISVWCTNMSMDCNIIWCTSFSEIQTCSHNFPSAHLVGLRHAQLLRALVLSSSVVWRTLQCPSLMRKGVCLMCRGY